MSSLSSSSHGNYSIGSEEAENGGNLVQGRDPVPVGEADLLGDARMGLDELVFNGSIKERRVVLSRIGEGSMFQDWFAGAYGETLLASNH